MKSSLDFLWVRGSKSDVKTKHRRKSEITLLKRVIQGQWQKYPSMIQQHHRQAPSTSQLQADSFTNRHCLHTLSFTGTCTASWRVSEFECSTGTRVCLYIKTDQLWLWLFLWEVWKTLKVHWKCCLQHKASFPPTPAHSKHSLKACNKILCQ